MTAESKEEETNGIILAKFALWSPGQFLDVKKREAAGMTPRLAALPKVYTIVHQLEDGSKN